MDCSRPGFPVLHHLLSLLKLMSIKSVMPSKHLILCCPLLLPSVFPSIRAFSSESALCISWPKSWSFSFSLRPSNEYSGLVCFRIDWFGVLAVQGTLKSLPSRSPNPTPLVITEHQAGLPMLYSSFTQLSVFHLVVYIWVSLVAQW